MYVLCVCVPVCACVCPASVERRFEPLPEDAVVVDPSRSPPGLSYWLNKEDYNSQQALLWCLERRPNTHTHTHTQFPMVLNDDDDDDDDDIFCRL